MKSARDFNSGKAGALRFARSALRFNADDLADVAAADMIFTGLISGY